MRSEVGPRSTLDHGHRLVVAQVNAMAYAFIYMRPCRANIGSTEDFRLTDRIAQALFSDFERLHGCDAFGCIRRMLENN